MRYDEFLKILTKSIFQVLSSTTNRNDSTLYHIFGYLVIFRLDELPFNEFKKIVYEQDPVKMNVFFQFLFDIPKVEQFVKPSWIEIFDPDYITETVIGGLEQHIPLMKDLLTSLSSKATGKKSELIASLEQDADDQRPSSAAKREPTKQQPFKLTQQKPKPLPQPYILPKQIKSNPAPVFKKSLQEIEKEKKQRLDQTKKKLEEEYKQEKQFEFKTDARPNNIDKVRNDVETELQKQLKFNKKYSRPMPEFENAEVKLNAAAVFREEQLIKKQQFIEKERVNNLEVNMRDSGEFEEWRTKMKDQEELERMEYQQRKKIEMELARESAMRAQEEKFKENKELAELMKKEQIERMKEREELQKEQVEHKRKLIESVVEAEKLIYLEKEKIVERNKKQAEDAKLEMAIKLERKRQEDEQIRLKREELIKQIRELEKQPRKRTSGFDPTETMGFGLLEEMSLAELRQRLDEVKLEQKKEEEDRRDKNGQQRDEYLSSLQQKVRDIQNHRKDVSEQKQFERMAKKQRKEKEEQLRKQIREEQLLEMQQKISKKKKDKQKEEERIAAEVKETKLKQQYMNANKAMVEEKAWKSQQDGLERELKERQNDKLINQERIEGVKMRERKILAEAAKNLVATKVEFNQEYDRTLRQAYKNNETLYKEERESMKNMHDNLKEWEMEHTQNMIERDQFKQKITEMSLANSKRKRNQSNNQQQQEEIKLPAAQYDQ